MPEQEKEKTGGGLSIQTLLISAGAAVVAATVVPLFWKQGTLFATAMTPVIVALASEALRKPVERVSAVAPRVTRRTGTGAAVRRYEPAAAETRDPAGVGARGRGPERFDPLPPHERDTVPALRSDDPFGLRKARRRPWLRLGLVTGLLAFVIGAGVVTASELAIFGGSVSGERGRTSLFGGKKQSSGEERERRQQEERESTPTATPEGEATPEPTATATPTPTPTPTPAGRALPETTATPVPPAGATPTPAPTP
jgi:hypothetical protein